MRLIHGLAAGIALTAPAILLTATASTALAHPTATPVRACSGSLETWFAPEGDGFAGGASYVVEFSNTGKSTCTVKGIPKVTLTENGKQVGLRASKFGSAPTTVTLRPGWTAHVALVITDAGAICKPVPTNGLSVHPPGKTRAGHFGLTAFGACPGKSTMRVDAIRRGVGIPAYTFR
jgi:hypothetical protein